MKPDDDANDGKSSGAVTDGASAPESAGRSPGPNPGPNDSPLEGREAPPEAPAVAPARHVPHPAAAELHRLAAKARMLAKLLGERDERLLADEIGEGLERICGPSGKVVPLDPTRRRT
jgi:hypothetical protein